ncbi:MAG: efflux RND transporter periplasmic adaptor subunit [Fibrobacterales bacterium]
MKHLYGVALVIGSILLFSCSDDDQKKVSQNPRPVKYDTIKRVGGQQQKTFSGMTHSAEEAKVSFRSSGQLRTLSVKVGQKVRKNAVLATLDNNDATLSYEKAKAALSSAEAQKSTASSSLQRTKKLYRNNNVALSEYERAKNSYANAVAQYESTLKTLRLQERQLNYTRLKAPQAGIITGVAIAEGEFVQAGKPAITLSSGKEMEISAGVSEQFISNITQNDTASISFNAIPDKSFYGVVTEVSFSKEAQKGLYPVIIKVLEPLITIRPGMSASVTFNFSDVTRKEILWAPIAAVGSDPTGMFIFTLQATGTKGVYAVKRQPIKTGTLSTTGYEILSGGDEGDLIATAGLKTLYDGMTVTLLEN